MSRSSKAIREAKANAPKELLIACDDLHLTGVEAVAPGAEPVVPSFTMKAYNGGLLPVRGFKYPVVVELLSATFERPQTAINRNHDQQREIGHTTTQRIDTDGIHLEGALSVPGADREAIIEAARAGKTWDASIEASFPPAEFIPAGRRVRVNNQSFSGPVYVARNAVITGTAILNRGADRSTTVAIAAEHKGTEDMTTELKEFIEAEGFDPEVVAEDAKQVAHFEKLHAASIKKPEPEKPAKIEAEELTAEQKIQQERELRAADHERINDINRICAEFGDPEFDNEGTKVSLAAHAIREGWDMKQTKLEAKLAKLEAQSGGFRSPAIHDATSHDKDMQVVECSLAMAAGVTTQEIEAGAFYDEKTVNEATNVRNRGFRVSRFVYQMLNAAGMYYPVGQRDDGYIEAAVKANQKLQASGFTTMSLPGLLRNVASKRLLAAYTRAPSFIPFVFGNASAPDFKPMYTYQLEGSGMLEKLGPSGEIAHGKLVENEYTAQLETYAKMLAFTRRDFINDDLGALGRIANILGVMAFKAREYTAMQTIANSTMFTSGNGNLLTSNDLSIDGLTASGVAFDAMEDSDGLPIGIGGGNVLVPSSLKVLASQLQNQTEIRNTTSGKQFLNNPHAGTFDHLATPWMDNDNATKVAGVTNADRAKTWYRFADPAAAPAFEYLTLNGVTTPMLQSSDTDFNTDGTQIKSIFDFGFGENDPKYAQKNVGA